MKMNRAGRVETFTVLAILTVVLLGIAMMPIGKRLDRAEAQVSELIDQLADVEAELVDAELGTKLVTEALNLTQLGFVQREEAWEAEERARLQAVASFKDQITGSHFRAVELGRSLEGLIVTTRDSASGALRAKLSAMQVRWYEHLEAEAMLHVGLNRNRVLTANLSGGVSYD